MDYFNYPKAVDVEVLYTKQLEYPVITLCNQNVYRASSTAREGVFDAFEKYFTKTAKKKGSLLSIRKLNMQINLLIFHFLSSKIFYHLFFL